MNSDLTREDLNREILHSECCPDSRLCKPEGLRIYLACNAKPEVLGDRGYIPAMCNYYFNKGCKVYKKIHRIFLKQKRAR